MAVAVACWLDVDAITRVLLIGSVLLVMIVEILNSAIEAVVDRIGSDFHELSGRAKDMGSAAVLLAIIIALITPGNAAVESLSLTFFANPRKI